jgi:hypothetical protein
MKMYQRQFARQRPNLRNISKTPFQPSARKATINAAKDGAATTMLPRPVYQGNQPMINVMAKKMMIWCFLTKDFKMFFSFSMNSSFFAQLNLNDRTSFVAHDRSFRILCVHLFISTTITKLSLSRDYKD